MIKAILFDVDGVVVKNRGRYFSEKYSEEYKIPLDQVSIFFKTEFGNCVRGKADLRDVLPPFLQQWGWSKSLDQFLSYWFESEKELDTELLAMIDRFRQLGINCYLVSDQEKNRANYLMTQTDLANHFDKAFFSMDLGYKKSEPEFFKNVLNKLDYAPNELMYWDDDPKNVDIAKQFQIDGRTYSTLADFEEQMKGEVNV